MHSIAIINDSNVFNITQIYNLLKECVTFALLINKSHEIKAIHGL